MIGPSNGSARRPCRQCRCQPRLLRNSAPTSQGGFPRSSRHFCNKEAEGGRSDPGQLVVVLNQHLQAIDRAFREPFSRPALCRPTKRRRQRTRKESQATAGAPMRAYMDRYQFTASGQDGPRSLSECMKQVWSVALAALSAEEQIRLGFWIGQVLDGRGSRRRDAELSAMDEGLEADTRRMPRLCDCPPGHAWRRGNLGCCTKRCR